MKKKQAYADILEIFRQLKKDHPSYSIGQHISAAFEDEALDFLTDNQVLIGLQSYQSDLDYDNGECDDIDKIITEGQNLSTFFENEEDAY